MAGGDVRQKLKSAPFSCNSIPKNKAQDDLSMERNFAEIPQRNEICYSSEGALPNPGIGNTRIRIAGSRDQDFQI